MRQIKTTDLALICNLRSDARTTLTELSKRTKVPISTVFDKLRNYENKFILKHTTLLDFNKFGFFARANVILKVGKKQVESIREYLSNHPNVNCLYKINNGFDFQVELIFKHMQYLEEFLDQLSSKFIIRQKVVYYLLDDIKRESFMTDLQSSQLMILN